MTTSGKNNEPIFVTGATGKTGSVLVQALALQGVSFRAGVRQPENVKLPDAAMPVRFDWDDSSTWAPATQGIETLYLVKPFADPVSKVKSFFSAAPQVRRVVLLSELTTGLKTADHPERAIELLVAEGGRTATILRPAWFYQGLGRGGQFGPSLRDRGVLRLPFGRALMAWVDVRDIVDIAVKALLGEDLGAVQITGPEELTLADLVARIAAASGREMNYESPPMPEYLAALAKGDISEYGHPDPDLLLYLTDILETTSAGLAAGTTQEVARTLVRPPRTLDAYIAENAEYWRGGEASP